MRRYKVILAALVIAAMSALGLAGVASAHVFQAGDNIVLAGSDQIRHTVFVAGSNVDISSEVFGDVFCAGQTITISGTIHGDVICAGQTVNILANVEGDVRLAGQSVTVSGDISGNATIAGQSFSLNSAGSIAGDLTLGLGEGNIQGEVGRDLAVGGSNVTVGSKIGRDIKGQVDHLSLSSSANVGGNIDFTSRNDISRAAGAKVAGKVVRTDAPVKQSDKGTVLGIKLGWFVYCLFAMLLLALILVLLLPRLVQVVGQRILSQPLRTVFTGFVASVVVPLAIVIAAVTVIGIPLALTVLLLWLSVVILSVPVVAFTLGRVMLKNLTNVIWLMLAGMAVLIVLHFIPIIGGLIALLTIWFGSGAVLLTLKDNLPKRSYRIASLTKGKQSGGAA